MPLHILTDITNNLANSFCCPPGLQQSPCGLITASGNAEELGILEYIKAGYESSSELFSAYPEVMCLLNLMLSSVSILPKR